MYNGAKIATGPLVITKKSAILKLAEYKSAVMVGSAATGKGNSKVNKNGVCEGEARVRAFMRMLRVGEGTGELDKNGIKKDPQIEYSTAFGGNKINDLSTHPMKVYGWSSAAGAYQIMQYTYAWLGGSKLEWTGEYFKILNIYEVEHDYRKKYKIYDYKPESQDKLCICLMKDKKGFIEMIIEGQIEGSIRNYGSFIWASLPHTGDNSRYKNNKGELQPATPMKTCIEHYNIFLEEELRAVSNLHLKKGFLSEFGYKCCSENNLIQGEICKQCKDYHYDVAKNKNWVHQKPSECWQTSIDILTNYGLKNNSGYAENRIIMADQTGSTLIPKDTKIALDYLDKQLKLGNPVIVGLDDNLRRQLIILIKPQNIFLL
ncbi:glycoside hydrolase family 104 protein [Flavobacterium sp. PL002]|uniref:glycoside hydrolase family 24 protein n=1 Tax=Flavobacterium sp. PL002 TaxID=1897058 RepID=UPI001CE40CEF|nr:glycoside hydrolase family 104 protein [Flavobacterium sp. PL002]